MTKTSKYTLKFTLQRIYLNSQGYTSSGAYYGAGLPLYWYESTYGDFSDVIRAKDRGDAKAQIVVKYPNARFYR